jgi:hypothetical protein
MHSLSHAEFIAGAPIPASESGAVAAAISVHSRSVSCVHQTMDVIVVVRITEHYGLVTSQVEQTLYFIDLL